ncbi:hypothetical protein COCC4DRAFT_125763 [Bipolaris maydis ATCC 48331]|uniref:Uncharacterized protein n=2 Tax=Cochliobolus heterostrophus TaxID=5016 RepID=M2UNQ6_COCH5|nr:uncharacterized protein COCC4DRAFT_125763 [Bipolaris maydis ATCC 48331]EMD89588.1 hypothetical protein COCHEDRAFT_1104341 [Bipolaris maydis C5]KAH7563524.1 hypothetical protein BM1_00571 [Bipolaris maydis]ENI10199.1 hypothetical protein COCC4DRAFT_125763 [Bipolaris maydis ATCC 48331]KAJ5025688.1 hypothetical protein J3E73DRAFT_319927 [Bipolaris maydis]KAJ5064301.1 hypothetical protein J3E74DRAFT_311451 [Bipolaris maydis]
MSQILFSRTPALRNVAQRSIPAQFRASYHRQAPPKMASGAAPIRTLLRQTTLRASAIAAQRTSYPASQQFSVQTYTQQRSRSPSPPPPYQARNTSILAAPGQWTRFSSPYNTVSSVRTFTSTARAKLAASTAEAPSSLSPESQQAVEAAIEEIQELYGTARDEFEIASEESEKNTTYAPDDRAAAREELDRLLEFYKGVLEGEDQAVADEVKRRVGQRIRELEHAVLAMEEEALHGD